MFYIAIAHGPATATDIVDVEVTGLDAHANFLLLKGYLAVMSLSLLVEKNNFRFVWNDVGAVLIDHAEIVINVRFAITFVLCDKIMRSWRLMRLT